MTIQQIKGLLEETITYQHDADECGTKVSPDYLRAVIDVLWEAYDDKLMLERFVKVVDDTPPSTLYSNSTYSKPCDQNISLTGEQR